MATSTITRDETVDEVAVRYAIEVRAQYLTNRSARDLRALTEAEDELNSTEFQMYERLIRP